MSGRRGRLFTFHGTCPSDEVSVTAQVIRLERNAAHPQAALQLTDSFRAWKKKVWEMARSTVAAIEPDPLDDW